MKIVGVGAGPDLLTLEAISAIESAEVIFGSKRAIELVKDHIKCKVYVISDYTLRSIPENAVVLATGDPMLSGLGKFAGENDQVIPGISSLHLACARLRISIEGLAVISAHSRDIEQVKQKIIIELENGNNIFLLPDRSFGTKELAYFLRSREISRSISICEKLGYPDEHIETGTTERPPKTMSDLYCIVVS